MSKSLEGPLGSPELLEAWVVRIAQALAREGAIVALNYASNDAAARETLAAIEARDGQAFLLKAELGSSKQPNRWQQPRQGAEEPCRRRRA